MKLTSKQIRQMINEELSRLNEVEYDEQGPMYVEPDPSGAPTAGDAEVLVRGYGGLRIGQIEDGAYDRISQMEKAARRKADELSSIAGLVSGGEYAMALRDLELEGDPSGVVTAFLQALVDHNVG